MAESCKTDCPIWLLSKGHVACNPFVRKTVEGRVLRHIDASDEIEAVAVGSLSAGVFDEVDRRIERLDERLEQVADECPGPFKYPLGGRLILGCAGLDESALEGILETQVDMITRLEADGASR